MLIGATFLKIKTVTKMSFPFTNMRLRSSHNEAIFRRANYQSTQVILGGRPGRWTLSTVWCFFGQSSTTGAANSPASSSMKRSGYECCREVARGSCHEGSPVENDIVCFYQAVKSPPTVQYSYVGVNIQWSDITFYIYQVDCEFTEIQCINFKWLALLGENFQIGNQQVVGW